MVNEATEMVIRNLTQTEPTPFYLYDLKKIRERIQLVQMRLSSDFEVFYSAKANSHKKILETMKTENLSVDVASMGELNRALAAGFSVDKISFTGPGKRTDELIKAAELGIGGIVVESEAELIELDGVAGRLGKRVAVVVRLSPMQRVGHIGRLIVDEPTQFGFDESSFESLVMCISKTRNLDLIGTHSHVQSQILHPEYVVKNFEFALEASLLFQTKLKTFGKFKPSKDKFRIALGGGIGIPYSAKSEAFDFDRFAVGLRQLTARYGGAGPLGVPMRFAMELGRYLVGESGYFVSKILREKTVHSRGRRLKFAIADGGYSHCQIACGVGQPIRTNLPFSLLKSDKGRWGGGSEIVSIAGPTCYTQDILVREASLEGIRAGDWLVVENVGAYGKQFSPTTFLLQPEAAEYFVGEE